jgi:hypothetical protein
LSASASSPGAQVWLAHYVDAQASQVDAGENRGKLLRHDRVVRQLWGPWSLAKMASGKVQPIEDSEDDWGLVAFVQDRAGRTLQSIALTAKTCGRMRQAHPDSLKDNT